MFHDYYLYNLLFLETSDMSENFSKSIANGAFEVFGELDKGKITSLLGIGKGIILSSSAISTLDKLSYI